MKKLLLILVGFALAVGVFGAAGYAYAQTQFPPDPDSPRGSEMGRGGRGGRSDGQRGPGMMPGGNMGLLEDYMHPALASALGLTVEELEAMHAEGITIRQYAEDQGISDDELHALMSDAFSSAINAAVADEVITQEQADFMLERMQNFGGRGSTGAWQHGSGKMGPRGGFSGTCGGYSADE